jgi:site-specific DNA-methyltransferase (adenine-specific)
MLDLRLGDCLDVLKTIETESIDSIVTDPPYGLAFMGKRWDYDVPSVEVWAECLRVLKPGGHLLAFAGTRTQHRMCVRIEDAGFEIRDIIAWVYGSGFPKSHNVSCAIDKAHGHPNRGRAIPTASTYQASDIEQKNKLTSNPVGAYDAKTDAARQWQGWGTALKPALEPITVARKPLSGTVADNVMRYGTGAINVDGCRVATDELAGKVYNNKGDSLSWGGTYGKGVAHGNAEGRWPANLIHDGSDEVVGLFPGDVKGKVGMTGNTGHGNNVFGKFNHQENRSAGISDSGSAARFFYCAKASKRDRDEGLTLPPRQYSHDGRNKPIENAYQRNESTARNNHPTVKPTDLMRYLCRLVTPPGGVVLDPFMGSGSTGKAAMLEGFSFFGIERESAYLEIAKARIDAVKRDEEPGQLSLI